MSRHGGALVMRAAVLLLRKRLASLDLVARYGFPVPWFLRRALILLPHLIALVIMVATEATVTAMAAFLLAWGILNFFWLAMTRRPLFAATLVARDDDAARSAVAAQIPRADDDGEFRRPDDRRYRYGQLSVHDLPGAALDRGAERDRARADRRIGVAARSVSPAPFDGAWLGARLRRLAHYPRNAVPAAAVRGLLWRQPRFLVRALGRRRGFRTDDARLDAVRRLRRRSPQAGFANMPTGGETAAHHPDPR